MKRLPFLTLVLLICIPIFVAGCSSGNIYVQPTAEELETVQNLHKTIAILPTTENGTEIQGISSVVDEKLVSWLENDFKIINPKQVQQAMTEPTVDLDNLKVLAEIGRSLNADFLLIANAAVTMKGPKVQYTFPETTENGFHAEVWAETIARTDISFKMISTKDAMVVYSDSFWGTKKDRSDEVKIDNLIQYNKAIDAMKMLKEVVHGAEMISNLKDKHLKLIEGSMNPTINLLAKDLRSHFIQTGEILQLLPKNEILINLGSAYGVEPNNTLSVWHESTPIKDPKTGTMITPKERIGIITIDRVTSGLSSVAKGKKKEIENMQVGDKVYMN